MGDWAKLAARAKDDKSWVRTVAPIAGAALAGGLGYKYLRRFRPHGDPFIRGLQQRAEREGATFLETAAPSGVRALGRLERWWQMGGLRHMLTRPPRKGAPPLVTRGVALVTDPRDYAQVGKGVKALGATDLFGRRVKLTESRVFRKGMPTTWAVPSRITTVNQLREFLRRHFPGGDFILKPVAGAGGHGADLITPSGPLHRVVRNPRGWIAQQRIPGADTEVRVHALGGRVIPGASVDRWYTGVTPQEIIAAERAVQSALGGTAPKYRRHLYGLDVLRDARTGKWKIIESNPAERGGFSGYLGGSTLAPGESPRMNAALSAFLTGRRAPRTVAASVLGLAGLGGVGASMTAKGLTEDSSSRARS